MLNTAIAIAHHQKCIMRVSDVADELCGSLDHLLKIRDHPGAVDGCRNILDRDSVQSALDLKIERLLIADQHWTVIERVEIGRGKDGCSISVRNLQHVQPGRNPRPVWRQLNTDRYGMLQLP